MTNPYQARVQQKRAHCRMMLRWVEQHSEVARQEREALLQGALIHLAVACRLYLREIANRLALKQVDAIFSVPELLQALPAGESIHESVSELQSQIWLSEIFAAERKLLNPLPPIDTPASVVSSQASGLIAVDSGPLTNREPEGLELRDLHRWFTEFEDLVERHRQVYQEF